MKDAGAERGPQKSRGPYRPSTRPRLLSPRLFRKRIEGRIDPLPAERTIRHLVQTGRIWGWRVGGRIFIPDTEVDRFLSPKE